MAILYGFGHSNEYSDNISLYVLYALKGLYVHNFFKTYFGQSTFSLSKNCSKPVLKISFCDQIWIPTIEMQS